MVRSQHGKTFLVVMRQASVGVVPKDKERNMGARQECSRRLMVLSAILSGILAVTCVARAQTDEGKTPGVGKPAPDFMLTSTTGDEIRLSQFHGKQLVLLEFYGVDFAPT